MNALTIAGSDPSSGAGVQRDLQVFERLGLYGLSAITAITSQNTHTFYGTESVSAKSILGQIDAVLDDFDISAIKIGMLHTIPTMRIVQKRLMDVKCPIIVDPTVSSTTGGTLLPKNLVKEFQKRIVPLAYAITPNVYECGIISGKKCRNVSEITTSASILTKMGAKNVLVTGVMSVNVVRDYVFGDETFFISHKKINSENRGSGCTFSSALAGYMAMGYSFTKSVKMAGEFAQKFIIDAKKIGKGFPIVGSKRHNPLRDDLVYAISKFSNMKNAYMFIPECQTNFVYAKPNPKTIDDVWGIQGRIVRTGKNVTICGRITLGGSRHVASAIIEMCKKFPTIRAAVNMRYNESTIKKIKDAKMHMSSYDRSFEPSSIRKAQSGSMTWGIREAIKDAKTPHDVIFHTGDHGKEPMILIFGSTPSDVLGKIAMIIYP
ncbi:MAG: hydroxymethylpyrimidine/phosphomethylpyrimidine kinase [Cenarchaeum symbiont of Oopsacas minuta]|nr:hydroxymethylpyrimidine/phosphomethylpyrimidine kinase [Cenarchaeum symbiont of Oopsacas minuta]